MSVATILSTTTPSSPPTSIRADAVRAVAISHALKNHYSQLVLIASSSPSSKNSRDGADDDMDSDDDGDATGAGNNNNNASTNETPSSNAAIQLERDVADCWLRVTQFAVDPRIVTSVLSPPPPQHHHHRNTSSSTSSSSSSTSSSIDDFSSPTHGGGGALLFMRTQETIAAIQALKVIEDYNPLAFFEAAVRASSGNVSVLVSPTLNSVENSLDFGNAASADAVTTTRASISRLLPSRYVLHALATRVLSQLTTLNTSSSSKMSDIEVDPLVHLLLDTVHLYLASLQSVVRSQGGGGGGVVYTAMELASSIWFAAPPGLLTRSQQEKGGGGGGSDDEDVYPSFDSEEGAFDDLGRMRSRNSFAATITTTAAVSMRVVLLYNLLVGRVHLGTRGDIEDTVGGGDDASSLNDEDTVILSPFEFKTKGLVERVARRVCASILSSRHPFSLDFNFCGEPTSMPLRCQAALKNALANERHHFAEICSYFKTSRLSKDSDKIDLRGSSSYDGEDEGRGGGGRHRRHRGRKAMRGINEDTPPPDINDIDPRLRYWGTAEQRGTRRIQFVDEEVFVASSCAGVGATGGGGDAGVIEVRRSGSVTSLQSLEEYTPVPLYRAIYTRQ